MTSFAVSTVNATFGTFGEAAVYEDPAELSSVDITVIPKRPDDVIDAFGAALHSETSMFEVRVSELASPAKGGYVTFSGTRYVIQGQPRYKDDLRLVWLLSTYPE